jgi:hypothetical protein
MDKGKYIFHGKVHIYLQGQNALIPVGEIREDQMTYFIGSKDSKLLVRDYRHNAILAAHRALSGIVDTQFADIFNQPAHAEIFVSDTGNETQKIEINLHSISENEDFPVLWLGVIDDLLMPMLDTEWEILRPISLDKVAFAAMVRAVTSVNEETSEINSSEAIYSFD